MKVNKYVSQENNKMFIRAPYTLFSIHQQWSPIRFCFAFNERRPL